MTQSITMGNESNNQIGLSSGAEDGTAPGLISGKQTSDRETALETAAESRSISKLASDNKSMGSGSGDGDSSSDDDMDDEEPSQVYLRCMRHPVCGPVLKRFPRTCAVFIGVVMPLFVLVFLSMGFGSKLSEYEAPSEIDLNNKRLQQIYFATESSERLTNLTTVLPRICFVVYLRDKNITSLNNSVSSIIDDLVQNTTTFQLEVDAVEDLLLIPDLGSKFPELDTSLFQKANETIDLVEFFNFLSSCGAAAETQAVALLQHSVTMLVADSQDLTFNWIRCYRGAKGGRSFRGGDLTVEQRSQEGQTKWYHHVWEKDREKLFSEYYTSLVQSGVPRDVAYRNATLRAVRDANGGTSCDYNVPAAAWFWFTVQTTIGYGNQAPETTGGRALVFTVGFLSILAFGAILSMAGAIQAYLFDDFVMKHSRIAFLAKPWVACIIWGCCYYAWMVLIAWITIEWKKDRLAISFPWNDSYWFAYISTTTVGLGDFFYEPEGLIGGDLASLPLLFLVGLMMLATFLGKFSELIVSWTRRGRKGFVQTLLEQRVGWRDTFKKDIGSS